MWKANYEQKRLKKSSKLVLKKAIFFSKNIARKFLFMKDFIPSFLGSRTLPKSSVLLPNTADHQLKTLSYMYSGIYLCSFFSKTIEDDYYKNQ